MLTNKKVKNSTNKQSLFKDLTITGKPNSREVATKEQYKVKDKIEVAKKISGKNRSFYAGAYWGKGFHEDGVKSAYEAVKIFEGIIK